MLDYQSKFVGEEFVTSIGHSDEFYVNWLFDRSIYLPMCTHMHYRKVKGATSRIKILFFTWFYITIGIFLDVVETAASNDNTHAPHNQQHTELIKTFR